MAAKKLEDQSKYDAYDMDGDGIGAGIVGAFMGATAWMGRK